jgi:hypothetical protein
MKRVMLFAILLVAAGMVAQEQEVQQPAAPSFQSNIAERSFAPTYSDLYCSGFISNENIPLTKIVDGGVNSPHDSFYTTGGLIFLSGTDYQEGAKLTVLRPLHDPNQYEFYKGQRHDVDTLGTPYAEIGRVRVVAVRKANTVAEVEFACQNITIGDAVVPFVEHAPVAYRKNITLNQFPVGPGRVSGRIVMAREFDTILGIGQKVYINAGANRGVKVGDYFRAMKSYDADKMDRSDTASFGAPVGEDNQKYPGKIDKKIAKEFPSRAVGQMIVLSVTPTSSTAMITSMVETIMVGDEVELEDFGAQGQQAQGQ